MDECSATLGLIAVADLLLIWAAPIPWSLAACVAAAGAGIGLSAAAAFGLRFKGGQAPA